MKEGLLEKIRATGHWRVNFRPLDELEQPLSLGQCKELVEQASVSIRGWDFPHISHRNDDEGGYERAASYIENWTDWWGFYEFWRMYKSSQFLTYIALREDTKADEYNYNTKSLDVISTIYSITEFMEFLHRLSGKGLYKGGALLKASLVGSSGRTLSAGRNRMPFFDRKTTLSSEISIERTLTSSALKDRHIEIGCDIALEIFDVFGWNPDRSQIRADQERFYHRDFAA